MASRGKRSLTHFVCFRGLRILRPTPESVALLLGLSTKEKEYLQHTAPPKTAEERLAALQLSSATINGGVVALTAMKSKETSLVWKHFETLFSLVFACMAALLLRWIVLWFKALTTPCCDDLQCWKQWIETEDTLTKPTLVVVALITWRSVSSLGQTSSQLPPGSFLRYLPSSYVTAWIFATTTFFGTKTIVFKNGFHSQLMDSLSEAAARVVLWSRWLGIRGDEAVLHQQLARGFHALLVVHLAWVGFVVAEPISSSVQLLVYQFWKTVLQKSWRKERLFWLLLIFITSSFPFAILVSVWADSRSHQLFFMWCWMICLFFWIKPLLQTYLNQSLIDIQQVFDTKNKLTSDQIYRPFQYRFNLLTSRGISLTVLPSALGVLIVLITLCHSSHDGFYSLGYGGPFFRNDIDAYRENLAHHVTKSVVNKRWSLLGTNSCGTMPHVNEHIPFDHFNGADRVILKDTPQVPRTLAGILGRLQSESHEQPAGDESIKDVFYSLLQHPLVTHTIARPVLDLWTILVVGSWIIALTHTLIFSQQMRHEIVNFSTDLERTHQSHKANMD